MSEHSVPLGHEFVPSGRSGRADPIVANLQQPANLANEKCDQAVALAQILSAQLREAQDRINQLEREAEGLGDQLLAEAKAVILEVRSNADARVNRAIREADERIDRLKAEAKNRIGRLQNELAEATRAMDQVKDEAGTRIESVTKEADARVQIVEAEARKHIDIILRENEDKVLRLKNEAGTRIESVRMEADTRVETMEAQAKKRIDVIEDKVLRLEADLTEARDRADTAEQCLMVIRREIEEHLMPAMRDGPKANNSAAHPWSLTVPMSSRSSVSAWFRRLWLGLTSTAARGYRVPADSELADSFDGVPQHESGFSNFVIVAKTANAAMTSGSSAPCGAAEIRQP
jgi:golgin subfamily B member 1